MTAPMEFTETDSTGLPWPKDHRLSNVELVAVAVIVASVSFLGTLALLHWLD